MSARARHAWGNLTEFGQAVVFAAVMSLLSLALVAMALASPAARVTVTEPTPLVAQQASAPVLPPALYADHLPTAETEAEEVRRDVADAGHSDEGERVVSSSSVSLPLPASTPYQLSVPPAEVAGEVSGDALYELALAVSGSSVWARQAVAVSHCESRHDPSAVGAAGERGLLQIHPVHADLHSRYELTDPLQNMQAAFELWQQFGWQIWSCRP